MNIETFGGQVANFSKLTLTTREYLKWIRSWFTSDPAAECPAGLPVIGPFADGQGAQEIVRSGYETTFRFVAELRRLVDDPTAAVMCVYISRPKLIGQAVYYCWKAAGPETGYPARDLERDMDQPGTLALYIVG